MRHCSGCFGVDVGNFHLTDINYADDAVLFTDDPTKWDYVFRNFKASAAVSKLATLVTRQTLVWKAISVAVFFSVQLQISRRRRHREILHHGTYRFRTDLLPSWGRYPGIPKCEILVLNYGHLTANISKTVSRSVTFQLELNICWTRAF